MKTTRLIAGILSGGLLGLTPLALAAPAEATEVYQPQASLQISYPYGHSDRIPKGEKVNVSVQVRYEHPRYGSTSPSYGTTSLQMFTAKSKSWVSLGEGTYFRDIKPNSNAVFRVVYSGYTAQNQYQDTYLPVTSAGVELPVTHKIKTNVGKNKTRKGTVVKGKITPKYKKKKFTILWKKKENAKYKKLRKVKTNKKGKFKVKLPAPRKAGKDFYFAFVTKGNKLYSPGSYGIITRRGFFRPVG